MDLRTSVFYNVLKSAQEKKYEGQSSLKRQKNHLYYCFLVELFPPTKYAKRVEGKSKLESTRKVSGFQKKTLSFVQMKR